MNNNNLQQERKSCLKNEKMRMDYNANPRSF